MLDRLRQRTSSEEGFTLVELLVVMLIIGLLAAIAIPSFFNQRDKARDADAKSSARTAQTAMETFATDNNGEYVGADWTALEGIEATLTDAPSDNGAPVAAGGADTYTITVISNADPANTFSIARAADGSTTLSCGNPGQGGCPTGGNWD